MTPIEIGLVSVIAIIFLIYAGLYIPIALGTVSLISVWLMRDNFTLSLNLMKIAVGDSAMVYSFATIPLFTFMGLVVSKAGLGRDIYEVMTMRFRKVKGGIGMATVGGKRGVCCRHGIFDCLGVGVYQSVRATDDQSGLQPTVCCGGGCGVFRSWDDHSTSAMLIIYSFVAEQSVGDMFLAGVIPGVILAVAYVVAIWFMGRFTPGFMGGRAVDDSEWMSAREIASKPATLGLITIILGGIYTGWMTAVESGAAGSLVALIIALCRRSMSLRGGFWEALLETGHITAAILFLITAASIYSRMLGIAGLPNQLQDLLSGNSASF